jgi:hypothetical protein
MRIRADGVVVRDVRLEVPQDLFRRLEREKERSRRSINQLAGEVLLKWLQGLPKDADGPVASR